MPVLILVLLISTVIYEQAAVALSEQKHSAAQRHAQSLGSSMLVIRNALAIYVQANPGASGPVELTSLGLPAWFTYPAGVHALIDGSRGYVYHNPASPRPDLIQTLGQMPSGLIGVARHGVLVSGTQTTTIALPANVPEDSIVLIL